MHDTLFILGREPELSVAELESLATDWSATVRVVSPVVAHVRHAVPLPERVLNRLGGSIKQIEVLDRWSLEADTLQTRCTPEWLQRLFPTSGRIEFGFSWYGGTANQRAQLQRVGLDLKKACRSAERPVRFVISKEPQLSAVAVQRNGLIGRGKEIVLVTDGAEVLVGQTVAVQDYQAYGLRDYGRPAANAKSGMLPPKLAQMMLNLARLHADDVLLDPFCGSGTVLQEAILLGARRVHGSDAEARPVKDSQENIRWLVKEFPDVHADVDIIMRDARQVSVTADVIVTEPYLGKPLRGHEPADWLQLQANDLSRLYLQCFQHWKKHLKPGGRVVMIWPEFIVGKADVTIKLDQAVTNLGFRPQPLLSPTAAQQLRIDDPRVLTYGREESRVHRQIRKWILG